MLSPFKTFLNNLQKNAGAKIFGLTNTNESVSTEDMASAGPSSAIAIDDHQNYTPGLAAAESILADDIVVANNHPNETHNPIVAGDLVHSAVDDDAQHMDEPYLDALSERVLFTMSDDQLSQESSNDPPYDPLALDDSITHNHPLDQRHPLELIDIESAEFPLIQSDADIIIVDANPLADSPSVEEAAVQNNNPFDGCREAIESADAEDGVRSDGSDSGLGLEPTKNHLDASPVKISPLLPLRTNLKRRSDTLLMDGDPSTERSTSPIKRQKRNITFTDVNVYYFQRVQGFICVPSQGGCTLGMAATHMHHKRFATLSEYAAEQRRAHRIKVQEQKRLSGLAASSSDESESDDEMSERSDSDAENDTSGFLQTVSPRQRRVLLKAAGVRKIEPSEKDECKMIRVSREVCGCTCRGFCDPETCACAQMGIKCQVDRPNFPCGCSHDGCGNSVGRVEFNPTRVRTHFIHTILRLELESKQQEPLTSISIATSAPSARYPIATTNTESQLPWHSHVGQTLAAAASASHIAHPPSDFAPTPSTDNLYSLNDGLTQLDGSNVRGVAGFEELDDHNMSHMNHHSQSHLHAPPDQTHNPQQPPPTVDVPTLDMHFSYRDSMATTNALEPTHHPDIRSESFPTSPTNTPAYMPSIYSPDSVSIVEEPIAPTTSGEFESPKPAMCPPYTSYGNVTGYQHSYLYSLLNPTHSNPKAIDLDLDDDIFGACTAEEPAANALDSASDYVDFDGSQTSADEFLEMSDGGGCGGPKEFESDLEPVDFESEINMSSIDKSLLMSRVSTVDASQSDDELEDCVEVLDTVPHAFAAAAAEATATAPDELRIIEPHATSAGPDVTAPEQHGVLAVIVSD